jgi:hypothetical protein
MIDEILEALGFGEDADDPENYDSEDEFGEAMEDGQLEGDEYADSL